METKYTITQYDNGWTMEDDRSMERLVFQEKDPGRKHVKMKRLLGEWLFEDMNDFLNQIESTKCVIELKFRTSEEDV